MIERDYDRKETHQHGHGSCIACISKPCQLDRSCDTPDSVIGAQQEVVLEEVWTAQTMSSETSWKEMSKNSKIKLYNDILPLPALRKVHSMGYLLASPRS